jgi:hypothetical protein
MLPTSNLIFVMGSIQAERFLYIPTIAMCLLITLTVYGVIRKLVGLMANDARTQRMALIVAARALLMGLALAFLIRSMWATLVWESDVKLWEAAVTVCPNSFKTHKSLAYAWYECTIKNMNKLREEREWQGKRQREIDHIVDEARKAIWATRKSQIVYVHLGAYLRIKGDLLTQEIPPPNSPLYKPDLESSILARAYACYAESASVLESAKPLDKAFSERNWRYEKRRGKSDEEIAAIGNYEIYWNLGIAYLRMAAIRKMQLQKLIQANPPAKPDSPLTPQQLALRNEIAELLSRAVASLEYMRLLAPSNVDAHLNLGSAYTEASAMGSAGAMDKAAVHFLSGWIVARIFANDNRPDILRILKGIYSAIATDPDFTKQPVVMGTDGKEYPNFHSCPPVREHFRQALLDLYDQFLKARDRNTAAAIRDIGIKQCNFPPETFPPLPPPPKRANLPQIGPTAFMFFSSLALIVVFIGLGWFATDRLLPQHAATPLPAPEETEPKPTQE